jgi:flagellar biosynthesis protein FlhG
MGMNMQDQADELRNLVRRASLEAGFSKGPAPRVLAMTGGKGGVGTTSLSIEMAVALSQLGRRVVLVDAALHRSDIAARCGVDDNCNIADVLSSRRTVHEVLQPGPTGVLVVPGAWGLDRPVQATATGWQRLVRDLRSMGRHADVVLVDTGSGPTEAAHRFWQVADCVTLVTTAESVSVMDTYATIKLLLHHCRNARIQLLVNREASERVAKNVGHRIDGSCRRFLGAGVDYIGNIPHVADQRERSRSPLLSGVPSCPGSTAMQRVAARVAAGFGKGNQSVLTAA